MLTDRNKTHTRIAVAVAASCEGSLGEKTGIEGRRGPSVSQLKLGSLSTVNTGRKYENPENAAGITYQYHTYSTAVSQAKDLHARDRKGRIQF